MRYRLQILLVCTQSAGYINEEFKMYCTGHIIIIRYWAQCILTATKFRPPRKLHIQSWQIIHWNESSLVHRFLIWDPRKTIWGSLRKSRFYSYFSFLYIKDSTRSKRLKIQIFQECLIQYQVTGKGLVDDWLHRPWKKWTTLQLLISYVLHLTFSTQSRYQNAMLLKRNREGKTLSYLASAATLS